ncbi:MAG: hypothetical protein QM237_10965 [Bacteroidota bacterium]|jgi:hypothetical protein|nr:hypothetical protein [Bacteroidota bacterium]HHU96821.1 hypothetical protein [Petrimonas sp.]
MLNKKNEAGILLPMTVTEGVTVNVLPNHVHEYLMTTKEVAKGYGVTEYAIRKNKLSLSNELVEGKHFEIAVTIGNGGLNIPHNAILWTKRGIVRLGFTMRSERAKLFRDWAEELIIAVDEHREVCATVPARKRSTAKRNHNRLTPARLVDILADVCRIDDKELRLRITDKLMGKGVQDGR